MIKSFRFVALFEGISYILLLFIGMPFKYFLGDPQFVKLLGLPHGIWFMIYIVLAFMIYSEGKWTKNIFYKVLWASVIPFGTFYVDYKHLRASE